MNRITKYRRILKYSLLYVLHTPNREKYRRKLMQTTQQDRFENSIRQSREKICIDLGANLGIFSEKMALISKWVIAFESDPWTCHQLRRNLAHFRNVKIENVAAGIIDDTVLLFRHREFAEDPHFRSQSSSVISRDDLNTEESIEVSQIDFIRYLEELDEDIGVLKIDIEGAEVDLLEALFDRPDILGRIDYIFAETHERFSSSLEARTEVLRRRAAQIVRPRIDLEWR